MKDGFYNGELGQEDEARFQRNLMRRMAEDTPLADRIKLAIEETALQYLLKVTPETVAWAAAETSTAITNGYGPQESIVHYLWLHTGHTEDEIRMHVAVNVMVYIDAAMSAERQRAAA